MRVRNPKELGLLLRQGREDRGWTQEELASRAGVTRQWVIGIEGGKPKAEVGLVLRAIAALDLTVDILPEGAIPPRIRSGGTTTLRDVLSRATGGTGRPPAATDRDGA
jgi:HTH-type transcriptional regulator/antitoxin HipB